MDSLSDFGQPERRVFDQFFARRFAQPRSMTDAWNEFLSDKALAPFLLEEIARAHGLFFDRVLFEVILQGMPEITFKEFRFPLVEVTIENEEAQLCGILSQGLDPFQTDHLRAQHRIGGLRNELAHADSGNGEWNPENELRDLLEE